MRADVAWAIVILIGMAVMLNLGISLGSILDEHLPRTGVSDVQEPQRCATRGPIYG